MNKRRLGVDFGYTAGEGSVRREINMTEENHTRETKRSKKMFFNQSPETSSWNLSEQQRTLVLTKGYQEAYLPEDVREFIRRLKEQFVRYSADPHDENVAIKIIDKLAGDALIK